MAKVAVQGSLSSNSLPFGPPASKIQAKPAMKRKTPSQLREEQLKRINCGVALSQSPDALFDSEKNTTEMVHEAKKPEQSKTRRYINTRVSEVYPVKKSNRLATLHGKDKPKDNRTDQNIGLKNFDAACKVDENSQPQLACPERSSVSVAFAKDRTAQAWSVTEKCSQSTLRSVAELSLGNEKKSRAAVNEAALKSLGVSEPHGISHLPNDTSERSGDLSSDYTQNFLSEINILGHKTPLDLTLKTAVRLVSSSSVNWCHRLPTSSTYNGVSQITSQSDSIGNQDSYPSLGIKSTAATLFSKSLHSWVYPQSSLPHSVMSAMTLSAGQGEMDFLRKRQQDWEESFRSVYYMLRNNICNIFYVCTSQFVIMFTGGDCAREAKRTCNAYVSQSTRGLRSVLREHDDDETTRALSEISRWWNKFKVVNIAICEKVDLSFSMPLCQSQAEHATAEDLVELSEIEKRNLGQTHHVASISDVDNCSQSLLAFSGNKNVHALYDFLFNYRSILSTLASMDVPIVYAPVPFQNASLSVPEVKCREIKSLTVAASQPGGTHWEEDGSTQGSSAGTCYIIEIKGTVLPPWTICGICTAMGLDQRRFELHIKPNSIGLNVALDTICQKAESDKGLQEMPFGVSEAVASPCLRDASLKSLKYSDGSFTIRLSLV